MSKIKTITTLSIAASTAFVASLAMSNVANAAEGANPFAMNELSGGYMQLADAKGMEGSCGGNKAKKEGSCGGDKAKKEGTCGEAKEMQKNMEGNCGGKKGMDKDMPMGTKGKKDGKCGEAKCGGNKK